MYGKQCISKGLKMVSLFKKLFTKKINIQAPVTGKVIPLSSVPDEVFSTKVMGDGFAIKPTENKLYSPISGTVLSVFPTKHAITFNTDDGIQVLLHLGIDTVELKGAPFNILVHEGKHISAGDEIGTMDIDQIIKAGKSTEIIIVITNMEKLKDIDRTSDTNVSHGDKIGALNLS